MPFCCGCFKYLLVCQHCEGSANHVIRPCLAAHPHTKLATLVYCEGLCIDVALVQEMLNGDTGPALVGRGL